MANRIILFFKSPVAFSIPNPALRASATNPVCTSNTRLSTSSVAAMATLARSRGASYRSCGGREGEECDDEGSEECDDEGIEECDDEG